MPSDYKLGTSARDAGADAIGDLLNSGRIEIRTVGAGIPGTVAAASAGTLLGTLTFSATAFGAPSTGVVTAAAITPDTNADASGDAAYFRLYANAAADTAAHSQGTAGNAGDTPDLVFDNKTVVAGGTIAISSLTLTMPIQ
jgi:hypothetical protein